MWNRTDTIGSVLLILVGIGVMVESIRLQVGTPLRPQPGFFPFLGGFLLIGLSLVLLVRVWLGRGKPSGQGRQAFGEVYRPLILIVAWVSMRRSLRAWGMSCRPSLSQG